MDSASAATWLLCLAWAASPADWGDAAPARAPQRGEAVLALPRTLQLAWTHSVERVRWQEWYAPTLPPQPVGWRALRARVQGSGAGMEPAPHAVWRAGGYEWTPPDAPLPALRLMASDFTADYTLCLDDDCRPLRAWLTVAQPTPIADNTPNAAPSEPLGVAGASSGVAAAVRLRPCPAPTPAATKTSD